MLPAKALSRTLPTIVSPHIAFLGPNDHLYLWSHSHSTFKRSLSPCIWSLDLLPWPPYYIAWESSPPTLDPHMHFGGPQSHTEKGTSPVYRTISLVKRELTLLPYWEKLATDFNKASSNHSFNQRWQAFMSTTLSSEDSNSLMNSFNYFQGLQQLY